MQSDITRLEEELAQVERAITEAEGQAERDGHPARQRLAELSERAGQLRAAMAVGGNVKDSILVVGNENRIHQNQYILPSEPQPPLFVGVPPMPPHFVGREGLVTGLVGRLLTTGSVVISVTGLPGVGKTALAVALAHDQRVLTHFSDGVLWAGLGQKPDVLGVLARWGEALGCDVTTEKSEAARAQAVKDAIGQRRLLLVIDDAWDVSAARWLRVGGPNSCHLLTTRDQGLAPRAFAGVRQVQTVPVLPEAPAFRLLQALAPEACAADDAQARHLAQIVGGLPLALSLLGGYLAIPEHSYFPELAVEALTEMCNPKRRLELASQRLGTANQATLQEVIELSLTELPIEAVSAFYALGAFAVKPAYFDRQAAQAVTLAHPRTLARLIARNLLEQADKLPEQADKLPEQADKPLALHQVLADVARTQTKTDAEVRHREHYLAQVNQNREDWRRIEAMYQQIQWAFRKLPANQIVIDYVAALRIYQERRGLWREQLSWTEQAVQIAQTSQTRQIEGTLLNDIGTIYNRLGESENALAYLQRARAILEEIGDQIEIARTVTNIGALYDTLGEHLDALKYYQRALDIYKRQHDQSGLAAILNNIGTIHDKLGQWEEALDYYKRVQLLCESLNERSSLATTLNNMGMAYNQLGQHQEAIECCKQALLIQEEQGDQAGASQTLTNLGDICADLGQEQDALAYWQRTLPILEELNDQIGIANTLTKMADTHAKLTQWQEALSHSHQALRIAEEIGDSAKVAETLGNLGYFHANLGQTPEMQDYWAKALKILKKEDNQIALAQRLSDFGDICAGLEQWQEALHYWEPTLPILEAQNHQKKIADTLGKLGYVCAFVAQWEKARDYWQRALPILQSLGDKTGERAIRSNITITYQMQDNWLETRYKQAYRWLRSLLSRI